MKNTEYRLGELFCGPGGIALGAKSARVVHGDEVFTIRHVWAVDNDSSACATYRKNICPERPEIVICQDVRSLDFEALASISEVDGLAFGFPCNDFSIVGERKGIEGAFGSLYLYSVEALQILRPHWFLAENVGGLRSTNNGRGFDVILGAFRSAGYKVYPHLYKFEKYGIPQARHRIVVVGIRDDIPCEFRIPSPEPFRDVDVSCRKAIEDPPIPDRAPNHELTKQSDLVVERLKHIKPGENAFTASLPEHLRLNVKSAKISQIYRRLDPDKPSYTITGSGGGGTHVYHWSENRALTNREKARLQTFPDSFVFCGSKESVRRQIGMAVPPKGAEIIFNALLASLAGIEYPSVPPNITAVESLFEGPHYVFRES